MSRKGRRNPARVWWKPQTWEAFRERVAKGFRLRPNRYITGFNREQECARRRMQFDIHGPGHYWIKVLA